MNGFARDAGDKAFNRRSRKFCTAMPVLFAIGKHVDFDPQTVSLIAHVLFVMQPVRSDRSHSGLGYVPGAGAQTMAEQTSDAGVGQSLGVLHIGEQNATPASTGGGVPGFELVLEHATRAIPSEHPPNVASAAKPFQTAFMSKPPTKDGAA